MNFGTNLRNLRVQHKLSQQELAKQIETSQSAITAWECGVRTPEFGSIKRIAEYFGVPVSSLITTNAAALDDQLLAIAESMNNNPKLRLLYELTCHLAENDLDAVLSVTKAISDKYKE